MDRAHQQVRLAVESGQLKKLDGTIPCVDCAKPATAYDHRDYALPLEVAPVCGACNLKRGMAKNHPNAGAILARRAAVEKERKRRDEIALSVGKSLTLFRDAMRISLRDLSKISGIPHQTLANLENGTSLNEFALVVAIKALREEATRLIKISDALFEQSEVWATSFSSPVQDFFKADLLGKTVLDWEPGKDAA